MIDRSRRRFVATVAAASIARVARAQAREFLDDAGRAVAVPARIARVFASGPPASVLVFAVAPDKLLGWTTPFRDAERPLGASAFQAAR